MPKLKVKKQYITLYNNSLSLENSTAFYFKIKLQASAGCWNIPEEKLVLGENIIQRKVPIQYLSTYALKI